jgi:hypothetical protein
MLEFTSIRCLVHGKFDKGVINRPKKEAGVYAFILSGNVMIDARAIRNQMF